MLTKQNLLFLSQLKKMLKKNLTLEIGLTGLATIFRRSHLSLLGSKLTFTMPFLGLI